MAQEQTRIYKVIYDTKVAHITCAVNAEYKDILEVVIQEFAIPEVLRDLIRISNEFGYIFEKHTFENFVTAFRKTELVLHVLVEKNKLLERLQRKRRNLFDDARKIAPVSKKRSPAQTSRSNHHLNLHNGSEPERENIAVKVSKQNCFIRPPIKKKYFSVPVMKQNCLIETPDRVKDCVPEKMEGALIKSPLKENYHSVPVTKQNCFIESLAKNKNCSVPVTKQNCFIGSFPKNEDFTVPVLKQKRVPVTKIDCFMELPAKDKNYSVPVTRQNCFIGSFPQNEAYAVPVSKQNCFIGPSPRDTYYSRSKANRSQPFKTFSRLRQIKILLARRRIFPRPSAIFQPARRVIFS